ncbi:hypothetical protein GGQ11_003368 [Salinibacter ruber]|nr:hypothetical protein [Salinibacter ruber]
MTEAQFDLQPMEHNTPPINLEETLNATEGYLERMKKRIEEARGALRDRAEEEAWKQYREVVDDVGDLLGLVTNDIQDLAPAEYFPNGWASILDVEEPSKATDEDRLAREFDPHDYESRDNIRLAIRGASQGGDLDAVKLGLMFAPPRALREEFGSEEDLREGLNRAVWNSCEGMTPGEIERELQAAERAVDNTAAKLIDYVAGRIDGSPPVSILWSSAWTTEVLNETVEVTTLPGRELPAWEEVTGDTKENLRKWPEAPSDLSRGAQDVLQGVLQWANGRPEHLWPEHKQELYGLAGEEVGRDGWGKDNPERPQNALEGYLRRNTYNVPSDVEELVKLARSTLNGH